VACYRVKLKKINEYADDILLTSQDTQNNSFTTFSMGFYGCSLGGREQYVYSLKYLIGESSKEYAEPKSVRLAQNLDNTSTGNSLSQTSQCCQGRDI
jgi:hypothetical protein